MENMENLPLFYDNNLQAYLMFDENNDGFICCKCKKKVFMPDYIFYQRTFSTRSVFRNLYCRDCIKSRIKFHYDEVKPAQVCNELPHNCKLISDYKPELKDAKDGANVFDVANSDKYIHADTTQTKTIDSTKHASRFSLEGAKIGAEIDDKREKEKTKQLSDKEIDDVLSLNYKILKPKGKPKPLIQNTPLDEIEQKNKISEEEQNG